MTCDSIFIGTSFARYWMAAFSKQHWCKEVGPNGGLMHIGRLNIWDGTATFA